MTPTTQALLLAAQATNAGDARAAERHLARARALARSGARRERHLVEIAALVVAGSPKRAHDLAAVHMTEFGDDGALLALLMAEPMTALRGQSGVHGAGEPLGDESGLVLALDLDGEAPGDLDGVALQLRVRGDGTGPDA